MGPLGSDPLVRVTGAAHKLNSLPLLRGEGSSDNEATGAVHGDRGGVPKYIDLFASCLIERMRKPWFRTGQV